MYVCMYMLSSVHMRVFNAGVHPGCGELVPRCSWLWGGAHMVRGGEGHCTLRGVYVRIVRTHMQVCLRVLKWVLPTLPSVVT